MDNSVDPAGIDVTVPPDEVGLAYVWNLEGYVADHDWLDGGSFEVDVNGVRKPARVSLRPLLDPDGERIKR